jgi:putative intracellular protease/amidase
VSETPERADELPRLLSALADGTLDEAGERRLANLLEVDPAARAKYYDHVMLAALLRREGRRSAAQHQRHDLAATLPVRIEGNRTSSVPVTFARRSRPWLQILAASVLLALLLSVGEATGVTNFVPTMIRIVTGEGSLLVEVDDPAVSVTLDGEDVTIRGAGIHELRLRPGTHKFVATKDGQPLREEVVTIQHGDKQVVKVTRGRTADLTVTQPATAFGQPATTLPQPVTPLSRPVLTVTRTGRGRVLIVLASQGFYYPEFSPVASALTNHGVECVIASTTLEDCQPNAISPQIPVKPNLLVASARGVDYDAICFCGGEGIEEYCAGGAGAADAKRLIEEALAEQRIVAAVGMGVVVLAEADALRDRRAACYPYGRFPGMYIRRIAARGAVYSEEGVVEDGLFLTARAPQDVRAFGQLFLKRLGIEPLPRGSPVAPAN